MPFHLKINCSTLGPVNEPVAIVPEAPVAPLPEPKKPLVEAKVEKQESVFSAGLRSSHTHWVINIHVSFNVAATRKAAKDTVVIIDDDEVREEPLVGFSIIVDFDHHR